MRRVYYGLSLFLALMVLGCQGETRHTVNTGENGSLNGLVLTPTPQSLHIDSGTDFSLDWQAGLTPPARFDVKLETVDTEDTRVGINTELRTISAGHYRLEPVASLSNENFLLLTVTGAEQTVRAIYLVDPDRSTPRASSTSPGAIEHTVRVSPLAE